MAGFWNRDSEQSEPQEQQDTQAPQDQGGDKPDELVQFLNNMGVQVNKEEALRFVGDTVQQAQRLEEQLASQQSAPKTAPEETTKQPESPFPTWDERFREYGDGKGGIVPTAPFEVRQKFDKWADFERERLHNPQAHYEKVINSLLSGNKELQQKVLQPLVQETLQSQLSQIDQQRQAEQQMKSIEDKIYQKGQDGQVMVGMDRQPVLTDVGNKALQAATAEMQRNGRDPSDPANETYFAQALSYYVGQFEEATQAPPESQQSTDLGEVREQNQGMMNLRNRMASQSDPGGDRDNNTNFLPQSRSNRRTGLTRMRDRIIESSNSQ